MPLYSKLVGFLTVPPNQNCSKSRPMKKTRINRTRTIALRLTLAEYDKISQHWRASTCKKLSQYVRHRLLDKPIVTTYRNSSQDDLMTELTHIRKELNAAGNNFNQAVKKLHTLNRIPEFKEWLINYENDQMELITKVDAIKIMIRKMLELWLQ
jgi:hypothetical protein